MKRTGATEDENLVECKGSAAFGVRWSEEHQTRALHPHCWHCKRPLGCRQCSGIDKDLLCTEHGKGNPASWHRGLGPVWATRAAFVDHGLLTKFKQHLEDYPAQWRTSYVATQAQVPRGWVEVLARGNIDEFWKKAYEDACLLQRPR